MTDDLRPTRREDLDGLLGDVERLALIVRGWDDPARATTEAYGRAIEALNGEAIRRLVRALRSEPVALAAMKQSLRDEVVYAVLRRHQILKPSLNERVECALEGIRPMLASHGGNVELLRVEPPSVEVRFTGACDGCAASSMTFHQGVETAVKEACPEITTIVQVKGSAGVASGDAGGRLVSPFSLSRTGSWRPVGELSQIPDGGLRAVEVAGESVLVARRGGVVTCFDNACAHLGLPLDDGIVDDGVLVCRHHGFRYDLTSGECLTAPTVQLRARVARVVGTCVEVRAGR